MTFLLCIKRRDLDELNDGSVISPGLFQPVCQQFYGLGALASQDEKTSRCSAESTHHPKNIFHCVDPFSNWIPALVRWYVLRVGCSKVRRSSVEGD
jgi:hypothetical protein